jgi:cell division protein FtsW
VFSIWAEETGFIGALTLILAFLALVLRVFVIGRRALAAGQPYAAYLCFGVALMFSGQGFVNMGVSAGLLPTKGLTLPLISYGGTSLITACALLGIVLRVAAEQRAPAERSPRGRRS